MGRKQGTHSYHGQSHGLLDPRHARAIKECSLRILLYGINFSPELTGIGKYTGEMAEWLADRGHEVRVVTAPPYYPSWRIRDDYRGRFFRTEHPRPGLTVYRTPLYVPAHPTGLKRLVHLVSFMLGSIPAMLRQINWLPDVVWTVEPTFFGAPLALLVARASGAASWLHVQDFEVDAAFDLGLLPRGGLPQRIALALERGFMGLFDRVSSISPRMTDRALAKGIPPDHVVLFPNWVDVDSITPISPSAPNQLRDELGLQGQTVLLYSGNMGNKQGLDLLPELASRCSARPDLHFVFCGDGAFRPQLESLVRGNRNVTLLPLQPLDRLPSLLTLADIHLLPQRAGAADLVMPSKLTGMLSSGRPVLVTADAGTMLAEVVQHGTGSGPLGVVVPAGDLDALVAAVEDLTGAGADVSRQAMGQRARDYAVQELGRDQVLLRFEEHLGQTRVP